MTQEEYYKQLEVIKNERLQRERIASAQYHAALKSAHEQLLANQKMSRKLQEAQLAELGDLPRTNHAAHISKEAHNFMRYIRKAVGDFRLDDKEFETADYSLHQHFDITDDALEFTINVKFNILKH